MRKCGLCSLIFIHLNLSSVCCRLPPNKDHISHEGLDCHCWIPPLSITSHHIEDSQEAANIYIAAKQSAANQHTTGKKMHNLNKRPSCMPQAAWLFVLQLTTIVSLLVSGAQDDSDQLLIRQKKLQDSYASGQQQHVRKCVPVLNPGLSQSKSRSLWPTHSSQQSGQQPPDLGSSKAKAGGGLPDSFTFPIGDIDVPLTQPGSSVQAAMGFLATFDGSDLDEDSAEGQRESSIKFVHNQLHISGLNLTMLKANLYPDSEPKFGLGLNIANTTLTGQFHYGGLMPTLFGGDLYSKLAGHYRMSIDNVLITASSNLTKRAVLPATAMNLDQLSLASLPTSAAGIGTGDLINGQLINQTTEAFKYRLMTNDFKMNISDLGYISIDILDASDSTKATSNYVLKMLQRVLQKTIKRTYNKFEAYISQTLESEGRRFLDCELTRFSPILIENAPVVSKANNSRDLTQVASVAGVGQQLVAASASAAATATAVIGNNVKAKQNNLEDLARIISSEISSSQLARVHLPSFEYSRSLLGTSALIVFSNGSLSGLDNVHLSGETKIKLQDEHLIVNASVGWSDLRPAYNWTLYLGSVPPAPSTLAPHRQNLIAQPQTIGLMLANATQTTIDTLISSVNVTATAAPTAAPADDRQQVIKPMAKGFVAFNIKAIDFDALISKGLGLQTRLSVDQLTIRRLDGPKMELAGLPGLNRLTRSVVNFFMGRLKQRLVTSVQPVLKQQLEQTLNRLVPFS